MAGDPFERHGGLPGWLQEKLFARRIVFVAGTLDDAVAARAAAELMTLDATGDTPINLYVDSADGTYGAAFVLIDTLDLLHAPVHAHGIGQVSGPAVGVIAVADRRTATPHASFRLVQPTAQFAGSPADIDAQNRQQQELLVRFQARVATATGRPVDEIADEMRRGRYIDAREALEYGLIDAISTKSS